MATSEALQKYFGKDLRLPHLWWGEKVAQTHYPVDWQHGHSVVKMTGHISKTRGKEESLTFKAEDGETYVIGKTDLDLFWEEGRFEGPRSVFV